MREYPCLHPQGIDSDLDDDRVSKVAELRPVYLPPDPASRTAYVAGEIAQHDFWFPPIELPVGFGQTRTAKQLPVLTMVCGYSRWLSGLLVPTRSAPDLFAGWWRQIQGLGAVPRVLVWDGESAVGRWRGGRSELTAQCQAFRGILGARVVILRPADPEAKGIIERAHRYLEGSFLPGRSFASPADFNTQLGDWLAMVNRRPRRALGCAPTDRIDADRQAMLTLPPVAPQTGWRSALRLPRDHYVRLDGNDYSVHPQVIGRRVDVVADLARVRVFCDGQLVADHDRIWATHQTISDPEHVQAAKRLRLQRIGPLRPASEPEVEIRCLADYDDALGLDDDREGGVA
jgi:transposase